MTNWCGEEEEEEITSSSLKVMEGIFRIARLSFAIRVLQAFLYPCLHTEVLPALQCHTMLKLAFASKLHNLYIFAHSSLVATFWQITSATLQKLQ